jgi:hypothetical protein
MYEFTGAFQDPFYMGYRLVGSIHMANLHFSFLRAFLERNVKKTPSKMIFEGVFAILGDF